MKILFLSENYFPNVSGVPVVVRYLAEGLCKSGHAVTIATSCYQGAPREEIIDGVNVRRFDLHKSHLDLYSGEKENYIKFVLGFRCDAVIMECLQCATTDLILPYLSGIKAKKILHSHGLSGIDLKPFERKVDLLHSVSNTWHWMHAQWYYRIFVPQHIKSIDTVLCLSEVDNTIAYFEKNNIRARILPNAVEDSFLQDSRSNTQPDVAGIGKPYFLSVAYYSQIKNQLGILEEYYKTAITDHAMVFIGPSKNDYYNKVIAANIEFEKKYGKRSVLFLTNIDRAFIPDIIGNAKLYLVGSTIEQFSIAMIETMAKGVPFVSTNVGNARMLPGGLVVDDIAEMSEKIKMLLYNNELYQTLSTNGRQYVRRHCIHSKVVRQLAEIIESN